MNKKMYHHYSLKELLLEDGMPKMAELQAMQLRDAEKFGPKIDQRKKREKEERARIEKAHKASRYYRESERDKEIVKLEKKIKKAGGNEFLDFKSRFRRLGTLGLSAKTLKNHHKEFHREGYSYNGAFTVDALIQQIESFANFVYVLNQTEAHCKVLEAKGLPVLFGSLLLLITKLVSLPATLLTVIAYIGFVASGIGPLRDELDALDLGTDKTPSTNIFYLWGFDPQVVGLLPEIAAASFLGTSGISRPKVPWWKSFLFGTETKYDGVEQDEQAETKMTFLTRLKYQGKKAAEVGETKEYTIGQLQYEVLLHFRGKSVADRYKDQEPQFGYIDWIGISKYLNGSITRSIRLGFDKWYGTWDNNIVKLGRKILSWFGGGEYDELYMSDKDTDLSGDIEKLEKLKSKRLAKEDPQKEAEWKRKSQEIDEEYLERTTGSRKRERRGGKLFRDFENM